MVRVGSDRPQVRYRVDPAVKRAFEEYVDEFGDTGQGRYGRHLERAMDEYVHGDGLSGLRQTVNQIADSLGVEKKKGNGPAVMADGRYHVPEGKNPGDVSARQRAVIDAILDLADEERLPSDEHGHFVNQKIVTTQIEDVAAVHSPKTVKRYLQDITSKSMFRRHPNRPGAWVVEP